MVSQKYRWDFIGLSTDTKPTSETSDKVVNGSTYYCSDTSKLYVYCDGTWYERKPLGGGGTSDFNDLSNRPKYNGSDMTSSTNIPEVKTYSAFTGTDGTTAGEAGLVPAPATADAGKFLSASGLWEEVAGGGGITELTSADYNYPTDNPTQIAAWLLPDGIYHSASTAIQWSAYGDSANSGTFIKTTNSSNMAFVFFYRDNGLNEVILSQAISAAHYTNLSTSSVKQSTGTSTTDVMSQNATTSMVYADPASRNKLQLGKDAVNMGDRSGDAIGHNAFVASGTTHALAVGYNAAARATNSVAIGSQSNATAQGEVSIGNPTRTDLYNNTGYRLLTGLYDPQSDHDAATKGYVDPTTDSSAPTTATVGRLGQIYIDTTNADAYMCVAVDTVTPSYTWKKITA